jgi:hypothetical protein
VEGTSDPSGPVWSNRHRHTITPEVTFLYMARRVALPFREVELRMVTIQREDKPERKVEMVSGFTRRMLPYLKIYYLLEVIFLCEVYIKRLQ